MYTGENLTLISTDRKQKQIKKSYTMWLPGSNLKSFKPKIQESNVNKATNH